jgi:hypothetical protein
VDYVLGKGVVRNSGGQTNGSLSLATFNLGIPQLPVEMLRGT